LRNFDESMTRSDEIMERGRPWQNIKREAPADVQYRTECGDLFNHLDPSSGGFRKVVFHKTSESIKTWKEFEDLVHRNKAL
jgi:hypothetical protein